jgi:hypothetical protein
MKDIGRVLELDVDRSVRKYISDWWYRFSAGWAIQVQVKSFRVSWDPECFLG